MKCLSAGRSWLSRCADFARSFSSRTAAAQSLLVLIACLSGCGVQRLEGDVAIHPDFTEEETEQILEALQLWCEQTGACLEASIARRAEGVITPRCPQVLPEGARGRALLSYEAQPIICLTSGREFRLVALHELGHAISGRSDHLEDGIDVMGSDYGPDAPTKKDEKYVREGLR